MFIEISYLVYFVPSIRVGIIKTVDVMTKICCVQTRHLAPL